MNIKISKKIKQKMNDKLKILDNAETDLKQINKKLKS